MKYLSVRVADTAIAAAVTRFNVALFYAPGAKVLTTPIANWFATTDPVTGSMIDSRVLIRSRMVDVTKPANDYTAFHCVVKLRKPIKWRDGDDLQLWILQDSGGNKTFNYTVKCLYKNV